MLFHTLKEFIIIPFNFTCLFTNWGMISFCHCKYFGQSNNTQSEILGSVLSTIDTSSQADELVASN